MEKRYRLKRFWNTQLAEYQYCIQEKQTTYNHGFFDEWVTIGSGNSKWAKANIDHFLSKLDIVGEEMDFDMLEYFYTTQHNY